MEIIVVKTFRKRRHDNFREAFDPSTDTRVAEEIAHISVKFELNLSIAKQSLALVETLGKYLRKMC